MSVSNEQLQLIERLLNLPGVRVLDVDLVNEREAPIQVETATDHAICQEWGQKVAEFYSSRSSIAGSICMKPVQIKVQYDQLLEMATAFGVRRFGAAFVVPLDSTDFRYKGPEWASLRSLQRTRGGLPKRL